MTGFEDRCINLRLFRRENPLLPGEAQLAWSLARGSLRREPGRLHYSRASSRLARQCQTRTSLAAHYRIVDGF